MARLADAVCLFDPFIQICQRREVIQVKCISGIGNRLPLFCLNPEKISVYFENRSFPYIPAEMPSVFLEKFLPHVRRIRDIFAGDLIFKL